MAVLPQINVVETYSPGTNHTGDPASPVAPSTVARNRELEKIERLRSKCADYENNIQQWLFMLRSYEGGPDYVSSDTLFQHRREHSTDYAHRLKRAHYQNYCQPLVDFVPEYIFSQGVEREAPTALTVQYEAFKSNCDRAGTPLNGFMQQVGEDARIFGLTFIHIDKLPLPEDMDPEEMSVQRAAELSQLKLDVPYFINVRPVEVYDWRTDERGNYIYLKRVQKLTRLDGAESVIDVERYTEWKPTSFAVSEVDVTDPHEHKLLFYRRQQENAWGVVPFVPAFYKRKKSNKDIGQSFLQDIAYQNRHVFNQTSLIDEFLYRQCFNILALPTRSVVPTKEQVDGDIGTGSVIEIPDEAKHEPKYISPPVDPAEFIQTEREQTISEMYRTAAQDVLSEIYQGQGPSGDAQKQSFSRTIPVINKTADMLEQVEKTATDLWAKMQGKDWKGGKISYKDDYSITNLLDLLLQLSQIFNSVRLTSPSFVRAEWKRVVREFDSKIPHDELEKIISEINNLSDADIKDMFKTPADIKAEMGVPATSNLTQGTKQKQLGSDKRISAATGSKASTKESAPDANKRAKGGRSNKRS
jgi:hypothetical protein